MPVIEVVQKVWVPEVPDIELPYEDGEPLESHWHRLQINLFGDVLDQYWQERTDFCRREYVRVLAWSRPVTATTRGRISLSSKASTAHGSGARGLSGRRGDGILMSSSNSFLRPRLRKIWDPRRICTNRSLRPLSILCEPGWAYTARLASRRNTLCADPTQRTWLAVVGKPPALARFPGGALSRHAGYVGTLFYAFRGACADLWRSGRSRARTDGSRAGTSGGGGSGKCPLAGRVGAATAWLTCTMLR